MVRLWIVLMLPEFKKNPVVTQQSSKMKKLSKENKIDVKKRVRMSWHYICLGPFDFWWSQMASEDWIIFYQPNFSL